ncbi:MAG: hypothetical protein J0M37_15665 [Ignavibacteria bacterium]|nr:hypothetical protein [Ignavibacteria bacterium]
MIKNIDRGNFKAKFDIKLNLLKIKNPSLDKFLKLLPTDTDIYIIGGFLRSINDSKYKPKDIDLIIDLNSKTLSKYIDSAFKVYEKNRMNGFKVKLSNITLDVWSLENNYAYKYSFTVYKRNPECISMSTFYNYDSISLKLNNKELFSKYYEDCIKRNTLDIVSRNRDYYFNNPKKEFLLLRAIYLRKKYNFNLSKRLTNIFVNAHTKDDHFVNHLFAQLKSEKKYQNLLRKKDIENFILSLK